MENNETLTEAAALSRIESMNLIDNFLFNEVVSDPKDGEALCRLILERVLKRKVGRIFLYTGGDLSEDAGEEDEKLQKMLRYICSSTDANITDDATRELDTLVKRAKHKKDIGVRYMKSWEILNDAKEEGREEGRKEGRKEERINTEIERKRADAATAERDEAIQRNKELEAEITRLKAF